MNDEIVREAIDDSEDSFIGPLAGAFPELASLTDADLEWAKQQWQRGLERQLELASSESLTDWDRLDAMQDKDIDLSDVPEITPEMFAKAVVRRDGQSLPQSPRFQSMLARSRESIEQGNGLSAEDFWQTVADRTTEAAEMKESAASRYAPFDAADYLDDEETIAEYLAAALEDPNPETLQVAVQDVLRARMKAQGNEDRSAAHEELHRRLASYQLSDRLFREKYGMTLEQFEAVQVVKQHGYSFEVENDHQDWDQAVDGIRTIERQLAAVRGEA